MLNIIFIVQLIHLIIFVPIYRFVCLYVCLFVSVCVCPYIFALLPSSFLICICVFCVCVFVSACVSVSLPTSLSVSQCACQSSCLLVCLVHRVVCIRVSTPLKNTTLLFLAKLNPTCRKGKKGGHIMHRCVLFIYSI